MLHREDKGRKQDLGLGRDAIPKLRGEQEGATGEQLLPNIHRGELQGVKHEAGTAANA